MLAKKNVFAILYLACILLFACKGRPKDHPLDMLRIDISAEVPTLDPTKAGDNISGRVSFDLFSGLVEFDQHSNPIPGMAERWEVSEDRKTYTFYLRKNLKFSDGSSIIANDFVYSWRRLVDPKIASPVSFLMNSVVNAKAIQGAKADPKTLGILAPDPYTLIVKLAYPDRSFLNTITLPGAMVVPQKVIEQYGEDWTNPAHMVSSGAYKLKEHVINGYILAEKNPYYYDAAHVKIQQIKYFPYESNTAIANYKAGDLDMTSQSIPADQHKELKHLYPKELHIAQQEAIYYYDFNMQDRVFVNNIKLRKALSMAIDRKIIVENVLGQGQTALYANVTPTVEGGKYASIRYDWASWPREKQIAEARKLYLEAGYGPKKPLVLGIAYNTNEGHKKIALAVAAMWKNVLGVQVSLQNQEWKTFIQSRHKGDYQIARDGWIADCNKVTAYTPLYECKGGANNSNYCNPQYDALLAKACLTLDTTEQAKLYQKALRLALNDYAIIPVYQYTSQQLIKPYVLGYDPEANHLPLIKSKWLRLKK